MTVCHSHVDSLLLGLPGIKPTLPTLIFIETLSAKLRTIRVPFNAILCRNALCRDCAHIALLNEFVCSVSNAYIAAADVTISMTSDRGSKGRVPGWKEFVELIRS